MKIPLLAIALAALPGCVFYFESDDAPSAPDAAVSLPDAASADVDAGEDPVECGAPLTCTGSPGLNKVTVCGQIRDVATDESVTSGAVAIKAYDALEFAGDPNNAPELAYESALIDACGRYRIEGIQRPSLGFLALAVDDVGDADVHAKTAIAFPVSNGEIRPDTTVYEMTHAIDAEWTMTAGLDDPSFVTRGALLTIFLDADGNPVPGVTVTEGGATEPANDFHFSDTTPSSRSTVDPAMNATGPNGAALKINSALVEHSGAGGCDTEWERTLAASIPDVLFVATRRCL